MRRLFFGVVLIAAIAIAIGVPAASAAPSLVAFDAVLSDAPPGGDGDGALEPGESGDVDVRVSNSGAVLVPGFEGTITPNAGVTVTPEHAAWPDLSFGQSATGDPPFRVALDGSIGCGQQIDLGLSVGSGQYADTLAVPIVAGAGPETASTDSRLPQTLSNSGGETASELVMFGPGTIKNLRLRIGRLDHSFVGDLDMTLTSPQGTTVALMDRPGSGLWGSAGKTFIALTLTDDAQTPIEQLPNTARTGVTGTYRPDEPLSAFDGEPKAGTWTLRVWDRYPDDDQGWLHSWGISPVSQCSTLANDGPLAGRDEYRADAGVALRGASVLANDSDIEADAVTAALSTAPTHGTLNLAENGTFTYTAPPGYAGTDSFTYRAADASGTSRPTKVTITVDGPQYPPLSSDQVYDLPYGLLRGNVLDEASDPNDDPITARLTGQGRHAGTMQLAPDGSFLYGAPFAYKYDLLDSYEYTVSDGHVSTSRWVYIYLHGSSGPQPPPIPPPPAPPPKPQAESRAFANITVKRAAMRGPKLIVRAAISPLTTGTVTASFRAAGQTTTTRITPIAGNISAKLSRSARQRRAATGSLKLTYPGSPVTRPERVKLTVARRHPDLRVKRADIDANGSLRVNGTIGRRVRGVVRVHLTYSPRAGTTKTYDYKATIRHGTWSLKDALPAEAASTPGQITIRYPGDRARKIAGAHISRDTN